MDAVALRASLTGLAPATDLSVPLQALWLAAKGSWDEAHELAQSDKTPTGALVHAHLHRIEGDLSNAGYCYRQADKPVSEAELGTEWDEIVNALA